MRLWALDFLRCPKSGSRLRLKNAEFHKEHVIKGDLISEEGISYPITKGVPRLMLDFQNEREKRTVEAFGTEWEIFNESKEYLGSQELFFDFMKGLSPEDFKDKIILEAGCGNGRWIKVMSELNCKYIVAMDFSKSVDYSFENTKDYNNVVVIQGSIYDPPLATKMFDLVLSIGVIDHLLDPKRGLNLLKNLLRKDAKLAFWVYALEGNELYLKLARPLRLITSKISKRPLFIISQILSAPIWLYAHRINKRFGFKKDGSMRLPMANYFRFLEKFKYQDIVNIVYDQLTPDLAHYIPKEQLQKWLNELNLRVENFVFRNSNSYSVLVRT